MLKLRTHKKKRKYDSLKAENFKLQLNDKAWSVLLKKCVSYDTILDDDVAKWHIISKINIDNVNTIAKDSCFHFHYLGENQKRGDYDNNIKIELNMLTIEKHFDFRLNGDIDSQEEQFKSYSSDHEILDMLIFRDELKAQDQLQSRYYY